MTNGNGTGVDLAGPLAGMWRDVYRKAAEVAEGRTTEQLKSHVYVYHPNGAGGGGGPVDDLYVNETGDTMTGTLHFDGPDVDAGGAIRVVGPDVVTVDALGYGPSSPTFSPTLVAGGALERGMRLRADVATTAVAVRWYRVTAGQPAPTGVHLWDATATGAALLSLGVVSEFLDTVPGWKEHRLTAGEQVALQAGRVYAVSYTGPGTGAADTTWATGYTPVPDAGLTFQGHGAAAAGLYPGSVEPEAYGVDLAVGVPGGPDAPAGSGAIRLPNGDAGVIAWNDADGGPDHTLTVNASDQLVYDGVPLGAGGGTGNTTMHTQTATPTGATNSLWFNPSESA